VFERFTESARQVIVLAQEEARILKHDYIGTEHLLLGLARLDRGPAAEILARHGLTVEAIRTRVVEIVGRGEEATSGQIPFTPRAKRTLERASNESVERDQAVGPEHLLLGVLQRDSVAMRVIADAGAADQLLAEVRTALDAEGVPYGAHVVRVARSAYAEGTYTSGSMRPERIGGALAQLEDVARAVALLTAGLIVAAAVTAVAILDAAAGSHAATEAAVLTGAAWGPAAVLVALDAAVPDAGERWPTAALALGALGLAAAGIAVHATALTVAVGAAAAALALAAAAYAVWPATNPSRSGR
jgi:hypothetical protein